MPQQTRERQISGGLGISYPNNKANSKGDTGTPTRKARQPSMHSQANHSRNANPKNYTSFSALEPPISSTSSYPAQRSYQPDYDHAPEFNNWKQGGPSRGNSMLSTSSRGSVIRKAKSADILRRFRHEPITGGQYIPLSEGVDENETDDDPRSTIGAAVMSQTSSMSSQQSSLHPQRGASRQGGVPDCPTRRPLPHQPSSESMLSSNPSYQQQRPNLKPIRTDSPSSIPSDYSHQQNSGNRPMSALSSNSPVKPFFSRPDTANESGNATRPSMKQMKRFSDISSGIHSKNAVILSAESGGMMLEYSPSGGGIWREGQPIGGHPNVSLVSSPENMSRLSTRSIEEEDTPRAYPQERRPTSRPRAESRVSARDQQHQHIFPRPMHNRSRSDGDAILARQGTLLHPASSQSRVSDELNVMLGKKKKASSNQLLPPPETWQQQQDPKIRLEASKKRKARVEVDVVLERDCVVEGGEVRGRMEIRVRGSKRSEGLRVGGGKIRVVGFEEISSNKRHIFYHHPHTLPQFSLDPSEATLGVSLFASDPDLEGFRLASEGSHFLPFKLRLPLNGGAKGSYTSSNGKPPAIRYVVVGSVKLHLPVTGKRSIAHFYRSITVLPYLKAAKLLAPSPEVIEARTENGLGWSVGGGKGKVQVRVALGRRTWVCGQKLWCEVTIHNDSSKRIKSLQLALLQTVQTFNPQPTLDPTSRQKAALGKRRSGDRERLLSANDDRDMDVDACQTSTQRRKVSEEILESDYASSGAGRVTGKGWWTGVEAGESGHWDLSIVVPPNMISIRRTRLIEVVYTLRVTISSSIYVDIPVELIDFLSIDPPPMPGEAAREAEPVPVSAMAPRENSLGLNLSQQGAFYPLQDPQHRHHYQKTPLKQSSVDSHVDRSPARESSNTLHIDQMVLQPNGPDTTPGTVNASLESEYEETHSRPVSVVNQTRPMNARMMSYLSDRAGSDESGNIATTDEGSEEADKALLAARRAQGRAMSLAALDRAEARASGLDMGHALYDGGATDNDNHNTPMSTEDHSPEIYSDEHEYRPLETPSEESYQLARSSGDGSTEYHRTPKAVAAEVPLIDFGDASPKAEEGEDEDEIGDRTVLEDLVSNHDSEGEEEDDDEWEDESEAGDDTSRASHKMRGEDMEQVPTITEPTHPYIDPQLAYMTGQMVNDRERHLKDNRSFNGSLATNSSRLTDGESEVGEVYQAVKRTMSMEKPSRTHASGQSSLGVAAHEFLDQSQATPVAAEKSAFLGDGSRSSTPVPPRSTLRKPSGPKLKQSGDMKRSSMAEMQRPRSGTVTAPKNLSSLTPALAYIATSSDEPPELTPSIHSESGSSEDHVTLESPHLTEPEGIPISHSSQLPASTTSRTLPRVPDQANHPENGLSIGDFAGLENAPTENLWLPANSLLRSQANGTREGTPTTSFIPTSPIASSDDHHSSESGPSSSSHESTSTNQSLLPSVKHKIAHLEERQEALRRMSLASFGTPIPSPVPTAHGTPIQTAYPLPALKGRSRTPGPSVASSPREKPLRSRTIGGQRSTSSLRPQGARSKTSGPSTAPTLSVDIEAPELSTLLRATPSSSEMRKVSTSSSAEPDVYRVNTPTPLVIPDLPDLANKNTTSPSALPPSPNRPLPTSPPAKTKRKSYTTALAPRPMRTTSDDTGQQAINTAKALSERYVVSPTTGHPRAMGSFSDAGHGSGRMDSPATPSADGHFDVVPEEDEDIHRLSARTPRPIDRPRSAVSNLRRDHSVSSASTSATTIEAALRQRQMRNSPTPARASTSSPSNNKPNRAQTMFVEGRFGGIATPEPYQSYGQDRGKERRKSVFEPPTQQDHLKYSNYKAIQPVSYHSPTSPVYHGGSPGGQSPYGGNYGGYHDPYSNGGPIGGATWVRPADRPGRAYEGSDDIEWAKMW